MSPLGNVTSSAPDRNGKGSNQKRTKQASLFISLLILSGPMIDIQSWRAAVYRRGQTSSKGNWLRTGKAEAALSHIGFAGCASRASGAHWSVSVTHRFLRRGKISMVEPLAILSYFAININLSWNCRTVAETVVIHRQFAGP